MNALLLVYILVALNFMFNKLKDFSCHIQTWHSKSLLTRHSFNILGTYFVIVLFTRSSPIHPLLLIGLTLAMYVFFLLVTRCDHRFLFTFLFLMCVIFAIESYKNYYKQQEERNKTLTTTQTVLQVISVLIVLTGFVTYVGQKSREYKTWDWSKFWLGTKKCKGNQLAKHLQRTLAKDFADGIKRITRI